MHIEPTPTPESIKLIFRQRRSGETKKRLVGARIIFETRAFKDIQSPHCLTHDLLNPYSNLTKINPLYSRLQITFADLLSHRITA